MANLASVTSYFPTADETYSDNLSAGIGAGVTTVPVNSSAPYQNGDVVSLVVDPGTASEAVFTGTKSGNSFINVAWTEGNTGASHALGATVVDYVTATHMSMTTKGILVEHKQNGTHEAITADSITTTGNANIGGTITAASFVTSGAGGTLGWETGIPAPNTVTYNGNRSYDMVFNSTDLTDTLSPGVRIRTTRTVTAPTQCTDLEVSSSQYWSKTTPNKLTFVDDFVASAWIKLESHNSTDMAIISRFDGTNGWRLSIDQNSGTLTLWGYNAGAGNYNIVRSIPSIPLGKWVHVTAQLDMSSSDVTTGTFNYIMFDGVSVPCIKVTGGTAPTSLVQAGNLQVGAASGGTLYFDGKIAQVAVFNAKVTQATMRGYISQGLAGTETSLASAYSFNGVATDLNTTTPNDLTASGAATATNADSPFSDRANLASGYTAGTTDFGIAQKVSFSTNTTVTVQVAEGCTIPTTGGVTSVVQSPQKVPYGFPADSGRWTVQSLFMTQMSVAAPVTTNWYFPGASLTVPVGAWDLGYNGLCIASHAGASFVGVASTLSTSSSAQTDIRFSKQIGAISASLSQNGATLTSRADVWLTAATLYYHIL
jgi:hypothetical protein